MQQLPMNELRDLIPDGWRAPSAHYPCQDYVDLPTLFISLATIEPPRRDEGIRPFDLKRLRDLVGGIIAGDRIPPIEISAPARSEGYQYRVRNGFHRFYLCKELGFTLIPAVVIDFDECTA